MNRIVSRAISRAGSILVLLAIVFLAGVASGAAPESEAELKARFSQRHVPLQRLKDAGTVGETTEGLVALVRDAGRGDPVKLPDGSTLSVGELVQAENADRKELYAVIAERTDESADAVAEQAAIRNFRQASPEHYLKLGSGKWVQKKQLPAPK